MKFMALHAAYYMFLCILVTRAIRSTLEVNYVRKGLKSVLKIYDILIKSSFIEIVKEHKTFHLRALHNDLVNPLFLPQILAQIMAY